MTETSGTDSTIFFGNGVWTTRRGAKIDLGKLENAISSVYSPEAYRKICFDLAYNTTNGKVADLLESYTQLRSSDVSLFWRVLGGLVVDQPLASLIITIAAAIDQTELLLSQDLSTQVTAYQASILEGRKAIVVAHSQGNFFANESHRNLTASEQSSFGIVAVATPASSVAGQTRPYVYTTLFEDFIWTIPGALPWNTTNGVPGGPSVSGHSFIDSYLFPNSVSRIRILGNIVNVRRGLRQPTP